MNTISKVRSVSMVQDYMLDELNCVHRKTGDFSFLQSHPDRNWDSASFLANGQRTS